MQVQSRDQQQRVAVARALAMDPPARLFDEPTSAPDPERVGAVLQVMRGLAHDGMTMMCVTHERNFTREVAGEDWLMGRSTLLESGKSDHCFAHPRSDRTRTFLSDS